MEDARTSDNVPRDSTPASWSVYFPTQAYTQDNPCAELVHALVRLLESERGQSFLASVRPYQETYVTEVDYVALRDASGSRDFVDAIASQPCEGLACVGAAIYEVLFSGSGVASTLGEQAKPGKVVVRLINFPESQVHIRQLKSNLIGRLATIRGTVVRMSPIKPLVIAMGFTCKKCGNKIHVSFSDGRYTPPGRCEGDGCRNRSFTPNLGYAKSIDWQKIRVQEILGADKQEEGRIPRTVEVELTNDLVDCCVAGDVVTVLGLVKVINTEANGGGKLSRGSKQSDCLFLLYLEAISVMNRRERKGDEGGGTEKPETLDLAEGVTAPDTPEFTMKDLRFVLKFSEEFQGDQFRQLLHALCPPIYGHELVKAGLLLSLMGGVRKHTGGNGKVPVRGDIHVLIVGDPGLGKSQLLQASCSASPRGIYVCGNTSTSTGLTVSVVRDGLSGDYVFEAGALVLADGGVCCIDEFDKMTADHQTLLEAMEQQEVSVAKAGLVANLPARTTVLAAANPIGGHYNRAKTVSENLKVSSPMLSRFDLVFILVDRPNVEMDQKLSEHVMALHSGAPSRRHAAHRSSSQSDRSAFLSSATQSDPNSLEGRLKLKPNEEASLLPTQLLRKYIAYARMYVTPRLSNDAKTVLQTFYLHLRQSASPVDGTPVTARQLESMVRLAEGRAKLELRELVTKKDAEEVVELMKEILYDKFIDETGMMDFRKGGGKGKRNEAKRFLGALGKYAHMHDKDDLSMADIYSVADAIELQVEDVREFVDHLNEEGKILKRGPNLFRVPKPSNCMNSSFGGGGGGVTSSQGMSQRRTHNTEQSTGRKRPFL
ncbi:hypothetical protein BSKO_01948 [Bryopsis sp. KO-2023]|nr:hypothetical protein BSKO_01948 [Bryopsis sp. KO-2023]